MQKSPVPYTIPPLLQELPDAPKQLWIRGAQPDWENHTILTFVGSRRHSEYGKLVTEKIIKELAGLPVIIVSGLALGTDAIVHRAALSAGLTTIAFPGSGLSDAVIAPATNFRLAMDILAAGGALISEYSPDQKAAVWTFPRRNRLMAGISQGVVVTEATEKSGTLITARLATEYNRDVFAVPGSVFREQAAGPHRLLAAGAYVVTSGQDLALHYGLVSTSATPETDSHLLSDLNELERAILSMLSEPRSKGWLVDALEKEITAITIALSGLEIKGYIAETYGKICKLKG
jgi:DNA processing protein